MFFFELDMHFEIIGQINPVFGIWISRLTVSSPLVVTWMCHFKSRTISSYHHRFHLLDGLSKWKIPLKLMISEFSTSFQLGFSTSSMKSLHPWGSSAEDHSTLASPDLETAPRIQLQHAPGGRQCFGAIWGPKFGKKNGTIQRYYSLKCWCWQLSHCFWMLGLSETTKRAIFTVDKAWKPEVLLPCFQTLNEWAIQNAVSQVIKNCPFHGLNVQNHQADVKGL